MLPPEQRQMRNGTHDPEVEHLAHATIGAAIEVHRDLVPGYLEAVYEEALAIEFQSRGIRDSRQLQVAIQYKGHSVRTGTLDFLVDSRLVVELKAVESLVPIHTAHVISYPKATKCKIGLLINFNETSLRNGMKRIVL
jgi:GxxExxY protein